MPAKGGARYPAELRWDASIYTPEGAKLLSDKELRKEYSRLRSIARKRLERFQGTEWVDTQVYQMNMPVNLQTGKREPIFGPLKELKNNRDLRHMLSDVARFVMAETSSIQGLEAQRDKTVKSLNERGYDFVNKGNFRKFADFMEYSRMAKLNKLYDSGRIANFFDWADKKKLEGKALYDAFNSWQKQQKKQKKIQHKNPHSSAQYRKDLYL